MSIRLKRIYEQPTKADGYRVLVDALWPRGVSKEAAKIDVWLKDIAPTGELRKWFGHDPKKWSQFKSRYFRELSKRTEVVAGLAKKAKKGRVTFLFAAKDMEHNNAVALKSFIDKEFRL